MQTMPSRSIFTICSKSSRPIVLDMIEVENALAFPTQQLSQLPPPFDELQDSQIFSVEVKHIKGDVYTRRFSEE